MGSLISKSSPAENDDSGSTRRAFYLFFVILFYYHRRDRRAPCSRLVSRNGERRTRRFPPRFQPSLRRDSVLPKNHRNKLLRRHLGCSEITSRACFSDCSEPTFTVARIRLRSVSNSYQIEQKKIIVVVRREARTMLIFCAIEAVQIVIDPMEILGRFRNSGESNRQS